MTGRCLIQRTDGRYLKSYDPEAHNGFGAEEWTADPAQAMVFDGVREALECWRAVPANHPVRLSDGKPNRPLTAVTITLVSVAEVAL